MFVNVTETIPQRWTHPGKWNEASGTLRARKKESSKDSPIYKMDEETGKLPRGIALVGLLHCNEWNTKI